MDWDACARWIRSRQKEGQRVVFTNGCFDLLHAGHIHLLEEANRLGDCLIVGVNSDESVQRLKGSGRPITPLQDRLRILEALTVVDVLVVFPSVAMPPERLEPSLLDTPHALLQKLRPDVLVKGGDYLPEDVVGREFAGEVQIVPLLDGRSTSRIIRQLDLVINGGNAGFD
ncbi:MAG: adenylyltransferase/cytidyltransferase family protein [Fidelibacterota bacterium]|nr:MAG: adenylyltransferase/cytidyltransferase family protein [Candidatus Neomarinimicrobiota bacterium]